MDRRKNERHNVGGVARFHWKDKRGIDREERGNVRNVSVGGIFIETENPPPVGTAIFVQFGFDKLGRCPAVSIRAKGRINRVERIPLKDQGMGFAVSVGRMNLYRVS
jgi:hypothetical protein